MIRALFRRFRSEQSGFTLVEVVATVVILGIIMVPLGTAMVVGFRTVMGIQERLANSADVRQLSTYFPQDVQSVDADGVNPATVDDAGICQFNAGERSLITFRWDADLGNGGQTVVRYIAQGQGDNSEIIRRVCRGSDPMVEIVVAKHFGETGSTTPAADYLLKDGVQTPLCFPRSCILNIDGAYKYQLTAQRRVEGDGDDRLPPGQPTNVHAIGGNLRATVSWADPPPSALPVDYYVIEESTLGIVGGNTPTQFPTSGAVINGLSNGTGYTFRVQAHNLAGFGPWSSYSAPVTPGPTTADPPVLNTASGDATSAGTVNAAWSLPTPYNDGGAAVTGFRLYALSADQTPTMAPYPTAGARTGVVTGLGANTHYQVQVTAMNTFGESSPSVEKRDALTLPAKPSQPSLAGSGGSAGVVKVTFTLPTDGNVSDLAQVRAKVGTSAAQTPVDISSACPGTTPTTCTLTVTGVSVNASTAVAVSVSNATGWSPDSDALTIPKDTSSPTAAIAFPNSTYESQGSWAAGCAGGSGICGTASDAAPGGVASVAVVVKRSDNKYLNSSGSWVSTSQSLSATGTTSWFLPVASSLLTNASSYSVSVTATDTASPAHTSAAATTSFTWTSVTSTTGSVTAPTNNQNISGTFSVKGKASTSSPLSITSSAFEYSPAGADTWTTIGTITTASPYTLAWDTTTVPDGAYNIRIRVTDSSGNVYVSDGTAIVVRIDNVAPTGSITVPNDGAFVRGNAVTVTSDSADTGSGVQKAQFQYKPHAGSTWVNTGAAATSSPYSVTWNTTSLADGPYDLRVVTTDNVGHTFTSPSITVTVDNTKPVIDAPTLVGTTGTNGWYTSDVTVTWPAPTDAISGIAGTSGCDQTVVNTNTQPAGQILTCSAFDNAGNFNSRSVTVKRDATPPTGNITAPPDGGTVGSSSIVKSDSDDDVSGVLSARFEYSTAGAGTWHTIGTSTTTPYQVTWSTTGLPLGSYDLRVVTTDNAGLTFTSPVHTVSVDSTPPTVAITFPVNNGKYNAAGFNATCPVGVCGTSADTAPGTVASVAVTIQRSSDSKYWDGSGTQSSDWVTAVRNLSATGTSTWTRALTTGSLTDGQTYTVVARATDAVGNVSSPATAVFGYDTTNPTGSITAPANNANVSATIAVTSSSADANAGVASAQFEYRIATSGPWTPIGTALAGPWTAAWDTTTVADGQYYLHVVTTDNAGNTFTSPDTAVRVRVDNHPPTGSIIAPTNGSYARGSSVTVSSNSSDAGSGVANVTFRRSPAGSGTWTTIGSASATPYQTTWNTTTLTDGSYDLQVVTTDNVGNSFTSPSITVKVDNTAPTIGTASITGTLGANSWYTTNVTVAWPAPTDASGIATSSCGPTSITTNQTGQVVTCSATDNAGNSASSSVTIKRDATAPTGSLQAPANGATVSAAVTVSSDSADSTPGSGVANAAFQYSPAGAGTWTTIGAPDSLGPYSVSWDPTAVPDGSYDLRVVTTDNAGLTFTSATRTVFVDTTAPTVAITFPADGSAYNAAGYAAGCATGDVCGTATDGVGTVASVTLTIRRSSDNHYWNGTTGTSTSQWLSSPTNLTVSGTTAWNRALTAGSIQNGVTYTIVATAKDSVGFSGTDTSVFGYTTTNPTGSITAPAPNVNVTDTFTVTSNSAAASASTVASATFQYKPTAGSTWTTIGSPDTVSPYSAAWNTNLLTDGSYDLRVTTVDTAGNSFTSSTVTVRVDNTLPTGALTAPTNGAYVKGTSVTMTSSSADTGGSGVANATFQRSPAGANTWTTIQTKSTPFSISWNTTTLTDGSYDLRVVTTDNAGNAFTSPTITVKVDNNAPTILANAVGTVGDNGWYTSNIAVTWTVTDAFTPITLSNCGAQNVTGATTSFSFTCTATDPAGNSSNGTFSGQRDVTPPTGSLTAPADGATVHGAVPLTSSASDATSGVASATYQRSPAGTNTWTAIGAPDTASPYSGSWTTTSGTPDGDYDLRVITTDKAGNTFTSPTRTVTVHNAKPVPTSLVLSDNGSTGNGKAESGDRVTIVYSEALDVSTLCSNWTSDTSNQSSTMTVTLNNSGNSDTLTFPATCSAIGTIDTNANYVSSTRTFSSSTVAWNVASRTLTVTLGTASGSTNSSVSSAVPTYTPTTAISGLFGNAMSATGFDGTSSKF